MIHYIQNETQLCRPGKAVKKRRHVQLEQKAQHLTAVWMLRPANRPWPSANALRALHQTAERTPR